VRTNEEGREPLARPPLFQPGHQAGDFLHAPTWEVLEEARGRLRVRVALPEHVRNPRGQLFGGFAGAYVDLVAIAATYAGSDEAKAWLATTSMRIDYLAPLTGSTFVADARLVAARGRTRVVDMSFRDEEDDEPAVLATVTMRQLFDPA
jgi:uncharacterized protein (TIGR00369 family)